MRQDYADLTVDEVLTIDSEPWFRISHTVRSVDGFEVIGNSLSYTVRYDTAHAAVIRKEAAGYWFFPPCDLAASWGGSGRCTPHVEGHYGWTGEIGGETVGGSYKGFEDFGYTLWHRFVSNLGMISSGWYDCGGSRYDLVFARVGRREIGTLPEDVATERAAYPSELNLEIYPNPASDHARILLDSPAAESVRLEIHDMLGRRVRVITSGAISLGQQQYHLDTMALPPGTYLVRAAIRGDETTAWFSVIR